MLTIDLFNKIYVFPDNGKAGEEEWNPWEEDERAHSLVLQKRGNAFRSYQDHLAKIRPETYKVQIWGKAAIGKWNMLLVPEIIAFLVVS